MRTPIMQGYPSGEMPDKKQKKEQDVIFFFGAGASVDAGIPDTYKFVEDFKRFIKEKPRFHSCLMSILQIQEAFNEKTLEKKDVDVEQLLDTLTRLINKDEDIILDFYQNPVLKDSITKYTPLLPRLKELLEDFIREKVVIKEENLEYLKELLSFESPLEIYSVNYDTCIEQLSHMNHLRYTDGFDTYWNRENFSKDFDVKHYKMHGSVIWYENKKTKEIVKIPVRASLRGKPVKLSLIYGEDVRPLLIYPAQKMEYVEPLTELQLMFKERLANENTKIVIVVGYSFRDDYIIHMLWDASRTNKDLHIVFISPTAQEHFENKLRFIDKEKKNLSRLCDRIVCLPYPFSTVIGRLIKKDLLRDIGNVVRIERDLIKTEKRGDKPDWESLLRICIDCEFSTKTEHILGEKIRKKWNEVGFDLPQTSARLAVKAMLHSVIVQDGFENRWLNRANELLDFLNIENLQVSRLTNEGFELVFKVSSEVTYNFDNVRRQWVDPILLEWRDKLTLLTQKFEKKLSKAEQSFNRLEKFQEYLIKLGSWATWKKSLDQDAIRKLRKEVLKAERKKLRKIFDGDTFRFEFKD